MISQPVVAIVVVIVVVVVVVVIAVMLTKVPQGSTLEPLLFNIFNYDLCAKIYFSECLLSAVDIKIFRVINCA
jgi:membrane-bound metal-dependent hydrolase YbcI (DUF457 family)